MIVPWLSGFIGWSRAPMTWTLVLINLFFFMLTYSTNGNNKGSSFYNREMLDQTGIIYFQHTNKTFELPPKTEMPVWGMRALRDHAFIDNADTLKLSGDEIFIQEWKEKLKVFRNSMDGRPIDVFGFSLNHWTWGSLFTYQFMHASWFHLFGNMMMFLIFAGMLETQVGSLVLLTTYLVSGVVGAFAFLLLGTGSMAPMVGASGSLSGVVAFYAFFERKKSVSFFYFLSPFKEYWGWIYLPTWVILPLTFASDVASYLGTSELGSGIAYSAHIGGALIGALAGFAFKFLRWERSLFASGFRSHIEAP